MANSNDRDTPAVLIVQPNPCSPSETFLQAHADRLPARTAVVYGPILSVAGQALLPQNVAARAWRKGLRILRGQDWSTERTQAYGEAIRRHKPDVVLAEYGGTGVGAVDACRIARLPLVVHFHGYDASIHDYLREMAAGYRQMFQAAAAVVAVSHAMRRKLIELGAPAEKVHWVPYGIDCQAFSGGDPAATGPEFLAVGRFTEKKAPDLTLRAFAATLRACPEARLQMIGFGPLLESAQALAHELGIAAAVNFAGACPPPVVQEQMRRARCFVQHSIVAPNGDSEGTPVSILEAGASGLPVISTRHAGIPDVVTDGETGFLVEERDVAGMADKMILLAKTPALAASLGAAARRRVASEFSAEQGIGKLWAILQASIKGT